MDVILLTNPMANLRRDFLFSYVWPISISVSVKNCVLHGYIILDATFGKFLEP